MNARTIMALLAIVIAPVTRGDEDAVFPHDAFGGEKNYRRTLEQAFPNLEFGFYHASRDVIIGLLEDFDHDRVLLLCPPLGEDVVKITRNGRNQKVPLDKPVTIKVASPLHMADGGIEDSQETATDTHLGYWIGMESTDHLSITLKPRDPWKGEFQADYGPDSKWQTSFSVNNVEFGKKDPADAYEISRRSLLNQVIGVLEQKNECLVRMKSGGDQVLKRWRRNSGADIDPMSVSIGDGIFVGTGQGRRKLAALQLSENLELYRTAAASSQAPARIRIIVQKDGDDSLFRMLLRKISSGAFAEVFVDFGHGSPVGDPKPQSNRARKGVFEKIAAIHIPKVNLESCTLEEFVEFLRLRIVELDPEKPGGVSILLAGFPSPIISQGEKDRGVSVGERCMAGKNCSAEDVRVDRVLIDVSKIYDVDFHVTDVGLVVTPTGKNPFPNVRARTGEVFFTYSYKNTGK